MVDAFDADGFDVAQAEIDGRQAQVVDGAVLEGRDSVFQVVPALTLDRHDADGAAGEPGTAQPRQHLSPHDQCADAGRIAEDLVERQRHQVGLDHAQVESIGGHESRTVQQDVPAEILRLGHQLERMLHTGEIRLRREGEQAGRHVP